MSTAPGWTVERWDHEADHPGWEGDCNFRLKVNADKYIQRRREERLAELNQTLAEIDKRQFDRWLDHRALIRAGRRMMVDGDESPPKPVVPLTLEDVVDRSDFKWRVVPLEIDYED